MSAVGPKDASNRIRYMRSIGLSSAIALGASISVGVGVYVLLGRLIEISDATTASLAYLIAFIAAIPIILTCAERVSFLPIENGVYGLARQDSLLWIPYSTGWLMFGGLACLTAVLGWGAAVYADLLIRTFVAQELAPLPWLAIAFTVAGVGIFLLWNRSRWPRFAWLVLAAVAFLALLAVRGFWILDSTIGSPQTSTVALLDVTVMVAASFWGIHFVLNARNQMHRPTHNLLRALATSAALRTLLGMAAGAVLVWYPGAPPATNSPLNEIAALAGAGSGAVWQVAYPLFGFFICAYALRQTVDVAKDLIGALRRDGFIPGNDMLPGIASQLDLAYVAFWAMAVAGVWLLAIDQLIELAAAGFLLSIGLAMGPALRSTKDSLPKNRSLKLPFHPLFPGLTAAAGLLLALLTLDTVGLYWLGWIALGSAFYVWDARSRAIATRRESVVLDSESAPTPDPYGSAAARPCVMVSVDDHADAPRLVRLATLLARERRSEVIVLKVLTVPDYVSDSMERTLAQSELEDLQRLVSEEIEEMGALEGVTVSPMVRLSSAPAHGILDTASEENAYLLLAGWRGEVAEERRTPDELLNDLVRYAPCPVAILRGETTHAVKRLVVFTAGGPNAAAALPLAEQLAETQGAAVELVTINYDMEPGEAQQYLDQTLAQATDADKLHAHVVDAGSLAAGIKTASEDAGLVLLGVSKEDVSDRSFFGGPAADIAYNLDAPSLLVRGQETVRYRVLQRMSDSLRDALPNLTSQERSEVAQKMRADAIPSIDFYVLIVLASAIATLGLLQSSTAVIIGAMLVAPLMSPILATGMSIVLGESYTLRVAVEATAKGIAVAILVGIVITMVSPFTVPTSEIMARTAPTVLDLMVALASGAAAGYAICRKEVAAALPGVAISAALVPPLCVVGYGIGTSQFDIATGSLLLFATNLVAIIIAGAIIFLALGFHPPRSEREEFRRNLWVSGISLGVVSIVLTIATVVTLRDANARLAVEEVFRQDMVARAVLVDKLQVDRRAGEYYITATVFTYTGTPLTSQDISDLQDDLSDAVGGPVTVGMTIVPATGSDLYGAASVRGLEEYLEAETASADVSIVDLQTIVRPRGIYMTATLVTYPESALTQSLLEDWQQEMTELAGQPVELNVVVVEGRRGVYAPTATPIATPTP